MNQTVTLSNLYVDIDKLAEVFQSMYTLTQVKITLYDVQHEKVFSYPEKDSCFCSMVKKNMADHCRVSDEYGFSLCQRSNGMISYYCHAGLIEVIVPLKQNGEILGYIMYGQMLPSSELASSTEQILTKFNNIMSEEDIRDALSMLTVWNDEQLQAMTVVIRVCISYLLSLKLVFTEKTQIIERINSYIDSHLDGDLSPEMISNHFSISRTSLYSLTKRLLGTGIMTYIRNRRIEAAKHLIQTTDLPLSTIAEKVGFYDYNYFMRIFKSTVGMTCKAYRKESRLKPKES